MTSVYLHSNLTVFSDIH